MIPDNLRPLYESEQLYTFAQSSQLIGQTGSIGHLRGDFAASGKEFHTTWFEHNSQLKTSEFSHELDAVVNALRQNGGLLAGRSAMWNNIGQQPDSRIRENLASQPQYGFRVDTGKHSFLIRCNPVQGDYNFYVYCFQTKALDNHLQNTEKGIRFIDSHYNEQFRIPDGGKIAVYDRSGNEHTYVCRFIDEYHTEIGHECFHICQFAERMEHIGASVEPKTPFPHRNPSLDSQIRSAKTAASQQPMQSVDKFGKAAGLEV